MTLPQKTDNEIRLIDLIIVFVITVLASIFAFNSIYIPWPIQVLFGLTGLLLAPGYVTLVAVLQLRLVINHFSSQEWTLTSPNTDSDQLLRPNPSTSEVIVLIFVTSISIVTILGLIVSQTPMGVVPESIVLSVAGYTSTIATLTAISRYRIGTDQSLWIAIDRTQLSRLSNPPTRVDAVLNISLVLVLMIGAVVVAVPLSSQNQTQFTEFALLAESESGDTISREYLATADDGENRQIHSIITNHEGQTIEYTLLIQVQRATVNNKSVNVTSYRRLNSTTIKIAPNETAQLTYEFRTLEANSGCRVAFLLYADNVPTSPTMENAYRELHLWHADNPPVKRESCNSLHAIELVN